jgi:hypothetical protein
MPGKDDPSRESTMVRRGKAAFSLTDMSQFVRELQERPLAKLIEDLPGLLELPESKFALVCLALGKRMRASPLDKNALEEQLHTLRRVSTAQVRDRCGALLRPSASA